MKEIFAKYNNKTILIIEENKNALRIVSAKAHPDNDKIKKDTEKVFNIMRVRNKLHPHLNYYKVNCDEFIKLGLTANDIYEAVYYKYIRSNFQSLDQLYKEIERITADETICFVRPLRSMSGFHRLCYDR